MNWLINECTKKHICIKDMKYDYLTDYFSSDILKISVGSSGIRDIKNGTRHISKILSLE
jgi:hypothetical protein